MPKPSKSLELVYEKQILRYKLDNFVKGSQPPDLVSSLILNLLIWYSSNIKVKAIESSLLGK